MIRKEITKEVIALARGLIMLLPVSLVKLRIIGRDGRVKEKNIGVSYR